MESGPEPEPGAEVKVKVEDPEDQNQVHEGAGENTKATKGGKTNKGDVNNTPRHVHFGAVSTHSIEHDQAMYVGRTGFKDLGSCTWSLCREFKTTPRWLENILIVSKINLVRRPPPPAKPVIKYPKLRMMED